MDNPTLYFVLLLIAVVLFFLSAFQVFASKINLVSLGLALAFLVPLIQYGHRL